MSELNTVYDICVLNIHDQGFRQMAHNKDKNK